MDDGRTTGRSGFPSEGACRLPTVITADVYPLGALHHAGPLQDAVVGLPLHLVLQGAHLVLRLGVGQIPCGEGGALKDAAASGRRPPGGGLTLPVASTRSGLITPMVSVQNFSKSGTRRGSRNRLMWMSDTWKRTAADTLSDFKTQREQSLTPAYSIAHRAAAHFLSIIHLRLVQRAQVQIIYSSDTLRLNLQ